MDDRETVAPPNSGPAKSTPQYDIQQDKAAGGTLHQHLRHCKPYKKRTRSPDARGQIIGRISIDDRPAIIDKKERLGDWEADTVIGKGHKGVLVTLADRVSKKDTDCGGPLEAC